MKLYQKLDSYFISKRPESKGCWIYAGSSYKFKSQKSYKEWLSGKWPHLDFKILKADLK